MRNFVEYMNSKGAINSPTVKVVADDVDCPDNRRYAPEQKGTSPALPYSNGKTVSQSKESGFGDKGLSKLKYTPGKNSGKSVKPAKLPTAETYDLFQSVRQAISANPTHMEQLVREFKRNGLLAVLVGELVEHKETFQHLAEVMASPTYGSAICKKLASAVREDISPPFSQGTQAPPDMGAEEDPNGEFGDESDDEFSDDEMEGEGEDGDGDGMEIGPDGLPIGGDEDGEGEEPQLGPDGQPIPQLGPDGQPLPQMGPDGQPLPPQMGPDGQPLPPQPQAPMLPPAMENLFAAFKIIRG